MSYLYARRVGKKGTWLIKMDMKKALKIIKENDEMRDYLGVIGGKNINSLKRTYGEYAPFKEVDSLEEIKKEMHI
ncbi:MAG: hypothetical protein PWP28_2382 [Oceanotoga sp.]|jgi:hypothetical protein|uniref:hypothetical protein n=1 Tax=Oceanotoga sp. TaxID=2108366 RepID=UPI002652142C|nr:hypothetical protein [Oceanotoga sp.]MDN5343502.1 hypothetical protein [Oceanotoga sp.]